MDDLEPDTERDRTIRQLLDAAFAPDRFTIDRLSDANQGRGVFSTVVRIDLGWPDDAEARPTSVIIKLPTSGANRRAAIASGAYKREAQAYQVLLPVSSVRHPIAYLVHIAGDDVSLVLEDLGHHRAVDQLTGLQADDALEVAGALRRLHTDWVGRPALTNLDLRQATPTSMPADALEAGLAAIAERWTDAVDSDQRQAFERLVRARDIVVESFASARPLTLCHGDPRADNLVFDGEGQPVFFDWQQTAVQFGTADLAWLATTSLDVTVRRQNRFRSPGRPRIEPRRLSPRPCAAGAGGVVPRPARDKRRPLSRLCGHQPSPYRHRPLRLRSWQAARRLGQKILGVDLVQELPQLLDHLLPRRPLRRAPPPRFPPRRREPPRRRSGCRSERPRQRRRTDGPTWSARRRLPSRKNSSA